ncbi:hypothetical protein WJX74_009716 [Apatococcus lobatus]|uniref:Uncharacterized protein n=2 Tax=Apatococcus TaxID=904362 RepID=A0AAW1SWD1_9CHLO
MQARHRRLHRDRASGHIAATPESESASILDAFFLGRAFAETLNERLGAFLGDLLSEFGKQDAERQRALKDFQDDIQARADAARFKYSNSSAGSQSSPGSQAQLPAVSSATTGYQSSPAPSPSTPSSFSTVSPSTSNGKVGSGPVSRPELEEAVDELRAEVASTRATVQSYKAKKRQSGFR